MRAVVTGFVDGKKIHAIKGIRAATGLGLKESKDVADAVEAGRHTTIELRDSASRAELDEMGVEYRVAPVNVPIADLVEVLSRFQHTATVGDLLGVLIPVRDMAEDADES